MKIKILGKQCNTIVIFALMLIINLRSIIKCFCSYLIPNYAQSTSHPISITRFLSQNKFFAHFEFCHVKKSNICPQFVRFGCGKISQMKKRVWVTRYYDLVFKWSGRQDSNLRPSAPKAPAQSRL